MNINYFKQNLRMKLKENKLTLSALSVKADLSEDTLRSIIYGKSQDIRLNTLIKIADALNCPLDELIGRTTSSKPEISTQSQTNLSVPVLVPIDNIKNDTYYDFSDFEIQDISNYAPSYIHASNLDIKILCLKSPKPL